MTDKQAIVTGAYGFLGRHVAKVFSENGYTVTGLGHGTWLRSEWQNWGFSEWHPCNISMDSLNTYVQQPDVVVTLCRQRVRWIFPDTPDAGF